MQEDFQIEYDETGLSTAEVKWTSVRGWQMARRGWTPSDTQLVTFSVGALIMLAAFAVAPQTADPRSTPAGLAVAIVFGVLFKLGEWFSKAEAVVTVRDGVLTAGGLRLPIATNRDVRLLVEGSGHAWVVLETPTEDHRLWVGRRREAEAQQIAERLRSMVQLDGRDAREERVPEKLNQLRRPAQRT